MKISSSDTKKAELDFDLLVRDLMNEYGTIFLSNINDNVFIYKPLSRRDYKLILQNPSLMDIEKEDEVCRATVLWPEDIDWDEIEAGVPTALFEEILKNSFMDDTDPDSVAHLIEAYREEMELLDTQMACIISEAFPNYDIEDIESWDMIKFCKIFSRAEWKLRNFRSADNLVDVLDYIRSYDPEEETPIPNEQVQDQTPVQNNVRNEVINNREDTGRTVKVGSREMSEHEYKQYLEFQKLYPDINWGADAMFTGYETQSASTVPVALRTKQ